MMRVEHRWSCDHCPSDAIQSFEAHRGGAAPQPCMPAGWSEVEGRVYCPKHTIEIRVLVRTASPAGEELEVVKL